MDEQRFRFIHDGHGLAKGGFAACFVMVVAGLGAATLSGVVDTTYPDTERPRRMTCGTSLYVPECKDHYSAVFTALPTPEEFEVLNAQRHLAEWFGDAEVTDLQVFEHIAGLTPEVAPTVPAHWTRQFEDITTWEPIETFDIVKVGLAKKALAAEATAFRAAWAEREHHENRAATKSIRKAYEAWHGELFEARITRYSGWASVLFGLFGVLGVFPSVRWLKNSQGLEVVVTRTRIRLLLGGEVVQDVLIEELDEIGVARLLARIEKHGHRGDAQGLARLLLDRLASVRQDEPVPQPMRAKLRALL